MRRVRPLATLSVLLGLAAASAQAQPAKPPAPSPSPSPLPASLPAAAAVPSAPAIGCPSLANLRLLLRQSDGKASVAAATLADPKTDHMSCTVLGQDRVNAITDHAALNGNDYDCVGVNGTSVCYWTVAGTVIPADPARATRKAPPAKAAAEKAKR